MSPFPQLTLSVQTTAPTSAHVPASHSPDNKKKNILVLYNHYSIKGLCKPNTLQSNSVFIACFCQSLYH